VSDDDHLHAARAILGGRGLSISTDELFKQLSTAGFDPRDLIKAQREFDLFNVQVAAARLASGLEESPRIALIRFARTVRKSGLAAQRPGWLHSWIDMGRAKGESVYRCDLQRRPASTSAQPASALSRASSTQKAISDALIAGAVLRRIEDENAGAQRVTLQAAIEDAINSEEIDVQEEAARRALQRFRAGCRQLKTSGRFSLKRYDGSIKRLRGRWVAIPDKYGPFQLPPASGGRPKKPSR
jgi:hypothetical protein